MIIAMARKEMWVNMPRKSLDDPVWRGKPMNSVRWRTIMANLRAPGFSNRAPLPR